MFVVIYIKYNVIIVKYKDIHVGVRAVSSPTKTDNADVIFPAFLDGEIHQKRLPALTK
jgi:hypothetical protein